MLKLFVGENGERPFAEQFVVNSETGEVVARNKECSYPLGITRGGWNWDQCPSYWKDFPEEGLNLFDRVLNDEFLENWWMALTKSERRATFSTAPQNLRK